MAHCDHCNKTGLVYEQREGTKHPYTCKKCERYDPFEADRFRLARNTEGVPVVHFE